MKSDENTSYREVSRKDISEISADDIGKRFIIDAEIADVSNLMMAVQSSYFECPSCGDIIMICQDGQRFRKPKRCGCGRKSGYRNFKNEMAELRILKLRRNSDLISAELKGKIALEEFHAGERLGLLASIECRLKGRKGVFWLDVEEIASRRKK